MPYDIWSQDGNLRVRLDHNSEHPTTEAGDPIIDTVDRPNDKGLTEWKGREPLEMVLSFRMDTVDTGEGQGNETKIKTLKAMQGKSPGTPEPPALYVLGDPPGSIPDDYHNTSQLRWWLERVEEDKSQTLSNDHGNRMRFVGVLRLKEIVDDVALGFRPASERGKGKGKGKDKGKGSKTYRVKAGDTLSKIAAAKKIKGGWKTLAKLNGIRDPNKIKVGQVIRLR